MRAFLARTALGLFWPGRGFSRGICMGKGGPGGFGGKGPERGFPRGKQPGKGGGFRVKVGVLGGFPLENLWKGISGQNGFGPCFGPGRGFSRGICMGKGGSGGFRGGKRPERGFQGENSLGKGFSG
jgi:hypothetical protein